MLFLSSPKGMGIAPIIELSVVNERYLPLLFLPSFHGFGTNESQPEDAVHNFSTAAPGSLSTICPSGHPADEGFEHLPLLVYEIYGCCILLGAAYRHVFFSMPSGTLASEVSC